MVGGGWADAAGRAHVARANGSAAPGGWAAGGRLGLAGTGTGTQEIAGIGMGETIVFFRDDDVGEWTPALRFHVDLLLELGISCHYLVVPSYLDAGCAATLRDLKQAHSALVHFNQHGHTHEQILDGVAVYSEFAGGRPYADQRDAIERGRDRLAGMLAEAFEGDVFTPPCHKYDGNTLRVLGDLGFDTLSAGVRVDPASRVYYTVGRALGRIELLGKRVSYHRRVMPERRLAEVSVAIDVHEDQDAGGRIEKDASRLWAEFEAARQHLDAVGIMTHHQVCDTPERQKTLRDFTTRLAEDPSVRFADLLDLAPSRSAA